MATNIKDEVIKIIKKGNKTSGFVSQIYSKKIWVTLRPFNHTLNWAGAKKGEGVYFTIKKTRCWLFFDFYVYAFNFLRIYFVVYV